MNTNHKLVFRITESDEDSNPEGAQEAPSSISEASPQGTMPTREMSTAKQNLLYAELDLKKAQEGVKQYEKEVAKASSDSDRKLAQYRLDHFRAAVEREQNFIVRWKKEIAKLRADGKEFREADGFDSIEHPTPGAHDLARKAGSLIAEAFAAAADTAPEFTDETLKEDAKIELTGRIWETVVIREGLSVNGRFYTRECLVNSIPLWEGEDVCDYGWLPSNRAVRDAGHIPVNVERGLPEGTFRNKVGHLRNVRQRIREGRLELVAEVCVTDGAFREKVLDNHKMGGKPPGLSIHAYGEGAVEMREGRQVQVVHRLTGTRELTVVSKPAAGGAFERLVAAETPKNEKENTMFIKLRGYLQGRFPNAMARIVESMEDVDVLKAVADTITEADNEGAKALVATALKYLAGDDKQNPELAADLLEQAVALMGGAAPAAEPEAEYEDESIEMGNVAEARSAAYANEVLEEARRVNYETLAAIENGRDVDRCAAILDRRLKESALPTVAADKIRRQFTGASFTESMLDSEIKYAKDILAVNAGGLSLIEGQTGNAGGGRVQILTESIDKVAAGADLLFGYEWQKDDSLTESEKETYRTLSRSRRNFAPSALYHAATQDYDHVNRLRPGCLLEAATSASFTNILSTSMNKALSFVFAGQGPAQWEPFIKQVDLLNFKQNDRHVAGGFSTLPTVAEAGTYQDLGVPLELPTNYTLGKKGGIFVFTEEMIFGDDLGYFETLIPALKDAGLDTRDRLAYSLLTGSVGGTINGDTSYDSLAHYHAAHDNLGAAALAHASLVTALQSVMRTRKIAFRTTISENHTDSVTTLTVVSTSGMQVGNFARINGEIFKITAIGSSTTATIVRAQLGSTAAAHTSGAAVIVFGGSLNLNAMNLFLVVPVGLYATAKAMVDSPLVPGGTNNDINVLNGRMTVVPVDEQYLGGDMNNWYLTTSWQNIPGLEIGYFNGERTPVVIVQDQPSVGTVFTNDQLTYKVKYRIGGKAIMHEGRFGAIVS